jgi:hypothetical protein
VKKRGNSTTACLEFLSAVCCILFFVSFFRASVPLNAQAAKGRRPAVAHDDVENLVHAAGSLPIEYRADIQLNVIESGQLKKTKLEEETLKKLFDSASTAQYPLKFTSADVGIHSRTKGIALAFMLNLDALSIRTRVVRAMLSLDRTEAQRELGSIHIDVPRTGCSSPLVYDVSEYYAQMYPLARKAFAAQKRKGLNDDEDSDFVEWASGQIRDIKSAVQLAPMAKALAKEDISDVHLARLTAEFSRALGQLDATDRELATMQRKREVATMRRKADLDGAIRLLADRSRSDPGAAANLVSAYRAFLIRSAGEPHCGDKTTNWNSMVQQFNLLVTGLHLEDGVGVLKLEDLRRVPGAGETAKYEIIEEPDEIYHLTDRIYAKRESKDLHRDPDPKNEGWESDLDEFFTKIDALDPSVAACPPCVSEEKGEMLLVFYDMTPKGEAKDAVLERLVEFFAHDPRQETSSLEWLSQVNVLLNMARDVSPEQEQAINKLKLAGSVPTMLPNGEGRKIRSALRRSKNPTLSLYATADEVLKNKFSSPLLQ